MTPQICLVQTNEKAGTFGDCMRACVASLLDLDVNTVPHFAYDNCDGVELFNRVREFVGPHGYLPFQMIVDGSHDLETVFSYMEKMNTGIHYMLFCQSGGGDHVVICKNDRLVHDPAWIKYEITGPHSNGYWCAMVLARP